MKQGNILDTPILILFSNELNMNNFLYSDREIRYKCSMQNTINDVLKARPGWQEVAG